MKMIHPNSWFATLIAVVLSAGAHGAINLLPGLEFADPPCDLKGKLLFLACSESLPPGAAPSNNAAVYEFWFRSGKLSKVSNCPRGFFVPPADGLDFCVLFGEDRQSHVVGTNAFLYSPALPAPRVFNLEAAPRFTVLMGGHAFFEMEHSNGTRIIDCELASGALKLITLPGASTWQYQRYGNIHVGSDPTNGLIFEYAAHGARLRDGVDYQSGCYRLNPVSAAIHWLAARDEDQFTVKSADDRYVFFVGDGAPAYGSKLVVSPQNHIISELEDPKGKSLKVLKRFSSAGGAMNILAQMSPCRRYALVKHETEFQGKAGMPGWAKTYYLVEVATGKTWVLLKDEMARKTRGFMSDVRWMER